MASISSSPTTSNSASDQPINDPVAETLAEIKKLEDSVLSLIDSGNTLAAARALNQVGRLQMFLHHPEEAVASHLRSLAVLRSEPDSELKVDCLTGLSAAYVVLEDEEAVKRLEHARRMSEKLSYRAGEAEALLLLSAWRNASDHALAIDIAKKALSIWQSLGDQEGLARTYSYIGRYHLAQNQLAEASSNYHTALQLWRELRNPSEEGGVLIYLGFIEYRKGEWQNSIAHLTAAQGLIDERIDLVKMGQISAGIAEALNETGLPEDGIHHYRRSLEFYKRTNDPHLIRYATWGTGYTYYLMGNYPEALTHLEAALADVNRNSLDAAASLEILGRVFIATGDYAKALDTLRSVLPIYQRSSNPKELAQVLALIGQAFEQPGQLNEGRRYYKDALHRFASMADRVNQAAVSYALGRLELRANNLEVAEEHLQQSIQATEDLRRQARSSDLTTAFSASVHERYQTYIECLMRRHQQSEKQELDVRAFETSELARARSLRELLRSSATTLLPGLDPALAQQEQSLRQAIQIQEFAKIQLLRTAYKKSALAEIQDEISKLEKQHREVSATIYERFPAYARLAQPEGWNLKRIQEQVIDDDQTALLSYSLSAGHSYLWVVTRTSIESHELPPEAQINEAALLVHKLLSESQNPSSIESLNAATRQLSQMVLAPIAALKKSRLIVVADGALHYVPFQALTVASNDEPLIANYEVINAPSASILGELREETRRRHVPNKLLAAFGDPVFPANYEQRKARDNDTTPVPETASLKNSPLRDAQPSGDSFDKTNVKPLFFSGIELANLRELSSDDESFIASSFRATREQLLATDLTQYAVLHLATHGFLNTKQPEQSGLLLSTVNGSGQTVNGFVGLSEIYKLKAPVDLVVLSACETALGKDVRGEGLIGLTRGFMYAGASSVVASLWKVDDEATAELMKSFYENMLQQGMPPAAALRAAQNSIRQRPEWRSPHHWAAFTLQGEYREVIRTTPQGVRATSQRVLVGLGLLGVLTGGFFLYLRLRRRRSLV